MTRKKQINADLPWPGMPASVKVGGLLYKIGVMQGNDPNINTCFGYCDHFNTLIRIDPRLDIDQAANTLIHEILHAIHNQYSLNDDSTEEQFTELTANGLSAFFVANPVAAAWWVEANEAAHKRANAATKVKTPRKSKAKKVGA